ncbi:MAG TPA: SoxR reducing system RseC family protein [Treponemataceae bacterium]|jgi:CHASE2 domain-containing sensor protein|nr:SoxR reducing system RseC family protein [Treponemataceae bacterium]
MRDIASVIAIDGKKITVVPIITDTCIGCEKSSCGERGEPFFVTNPQNLSLSIGSSVKIHARAKDQMLQALFAIFLPVLLAILSFVLIGILAHSLGRHVNTESIERLKTLGAIGILFISSLLIMLKNRFFPPRGQSEIIAVL